MKSEIIHQLVHTLTFGDAISGEVFALKRALNSRGVESEIYAINIDPKYKGMARDYRELPNSFKGEVILHYSLGSPLNELYRSLKGARRSLIHHNLTPAHWFAGINPRIAKDIEHGRLELPELCALSDKLLADSSFNAAEISSSGRSVQVLELPIDPDKWNEPANPGILALLKNDPALHVLHVGRMAPNKCIEDIIKSFYFLVRYLEVPAKLWLAGHDIDTELYSFSLKRLVRELDIMESVFFVGRRADSEVRALYEASTVYLCMSEHEGFCCPLLEAMHFGLPVVAYAAAAVPDTLADAGILLKEKRYPQIAELLKKIYLDNSFKQQLIEAGHRRVSQLSFEHFVERVENIFLRAEHSSRIAGGVGHA